MQKILILISLLALVGCVEQVKGPSRDQVEPVSAVELLRKQHKDELTEWQKLQLAIIFTESKGNPNAIGSAGDSGVYQMLPCYVAEANRVSGSNYSHEDAFDIDYAIDIFNRLQSHYNSEKDIEKAIAHHNKSSVYKATVLRNLELVERMEVVRQKLIEYDSDNH